MIITPTPISDLNGALFDFLRGPTIERFVPRVYSDSLGVPTLGVGYALVVKVGSTWQVRAGLAEDLAAIGVTLSGDDLVRLNQTISVLNGLGGTNPIPTYVIGEKSERALEK